MTSKHAISVPAGHGFKASKEVGNAYAPAIAAQNARKIFCWSIASDMKAERASFRSRSCGRVLLPSSQPVRSHGYRQLPGFSSFHPFTHVLDMNIAVF